MRTRSSSNLPVESPPDPSTSNPKHHNCRRSKQPFILEESSVDTMADQRTMAEFLRAPTEGYAEAIMVPPILADDANSNSSSEITKLTHAVNQQTSDVTTAMTAILKQFQETLPPASIKAVEEIYVTCGGAHPYYQCLTADGNTFLKLRDNIQGYVAAAAVNYNQGNFTYRPLGVANQFRHQNRFSQPQGYNRGSRSLPSNTIANPKGELKAITTRSGIVLDGPFVPIPPPFINPEEDECVEETLTDQDLAEYTIKVPPPLVQKPKPPSQKNFVVHQRDPLHPNIPYPSRMLKQKQQEKDEKMLKALLSNKEKLLELANTPLNENCSAVILKKLPEKLGDPEKFLIPCGFSLPELIFTRMTLELANQAICTPSGIARDVFVPVGKFTFPADFVIVDYESDPRVFLILGRPFLQTAHALIDPSGNPTISSHQILTSPKVKDDVFDPEGGNVLIEKLLDLDSIEDLYPPHHVSTTTSSSPNQLLEEFTDELALITFPPGNDDLPFDIESDLKEIEYLLHHDPIKDIDSNLKDSINQSNLANLNDNLVDTIPKMFTDEHALDYSSPLLYDKYDYDLFEVESDTEYVDALPSTNNEDMVFNPGILIQENLFEVITRVAPEKNAKKLSISHASLILEDFDPPLYELPCFKEMFTDEHALDYSSPLLYDKYDYDLFEVESDTEYVYDDHFDSKGEKIKESKLLIDELDLPNNFLPSFEYDLFFSKDFSKVDALPSTNNEDMNAKKLSISHASLILEDFDPPLYELPCFKEVLRSKILLSFSSENKGKLKYGGNWVKLSDPKQALRERHPMLILGIPGI
uniref:Reverse transcriptase domain-containing protein n=1 Tax=Tanacetum cinerariifolium TaxID=118510 RepID=A0A6L2KEK7_TANCI|nr:hypothetical protein [Tanacetum cinerariifolium]